MLPCPVKVLTGIPCPGCGFQRSLLALLQGHWADSIEHYPSVIPLLMVLLFALIRRPLGIDKRNIVLHTLAIVSGWFMLAVYVVRLWNGYGD